MSKFARPFIMLTVGAFTFNPERINYIYENPGDGTASMMFSDGKWCHVDITPKELSTLIQESYYRFADMATDA